uniref:GAIN domain-containing protein n=1 Tax=Caenorhabditis tropicalis TaxID=1561998 RepID=A0A1I7TL69_9PELO
MSLRRSTRIAALKTPIPKVQPKTPAIAKPKSVQKKRNSQAADNTPKTTATPKAATSRASTSGTSTSRASSSRQSTSKASASKPSTSKASTTKAVTQKNKSQTSVNVSSSTQTETKDVQEPSSRAAELITSTPKAAPQEKKVQDLLNVSSEKKVQALLTQTDTKDVQEPSSSRNQTTTTVKRETVAECKKRREVPAETGFYEPEIQTTTTVKRENVADCKKRREVPAETGPDVLEVRAIERFENTILCNASSNHERNLDFYNCVQLWGALQQVAKQFTDDGVAGLRGLFLEIRSVLEKTALKKNHPQMLTADLPELFNYHLSRIISTSQPYYDYYGNEGVQVNTRLFLRRLETAIVEKRKHSQGMLSQPHS